MHTNDSAILSRRRLIGGLIAASAAASASMAAGGRALAAPAINTGAGDVRLINLTNPRTGDRVNSVYWIEGEYLPEVMAEIDFLMRDWRRDLVVRISPEVVDIMAAAHKKLDTREPFTVFSGYRSPQTNQMLRRRNRGVARNSYHMKGMAADLHLKERSVAQMYRAAHSLGAGGVGRYTRSSFVHMDCGPVRTWGR